jgi:hypothetical protein
METLIYIGLVLGPLFLFVLLFWRYPAQAGLAFLFVVVVLDCLEIGASGIDAGISLYFDDVACAVLIAGAVIIAGRSGRLPANYCWPALSLFGLAVMNFLRGAPVYGLRHAGNDARAMVYFVIPAMAFSAFRPAFRISAERLVTWLCGASYVLAAVAVCRWLGVLPTPEVFTGDFRTIVRVLTSSYAMVMALAFIAVLANQIIRGLQATGLLTAGIFGLFVLALQHRSVWTASVVGVAWLAFRTFRLANRRWIQVSLVAVPVIALGIAFLFVSGRADNVISLAKANIEETRQSNSTWAWRVDGFSEATDRALSNGLLDLAVGPPAGRDLTDVATEASIHIHDQYIATFAYYGVAGLLVFVVWMGMLARHIGRVGLSTIVPSLSNRIAGATLAALFVSELAYMTAYSGGLIQGTVFGLLWAASAGEVTIAQGAREKVPESL